MIVRVWDSFLRERTKRTARVPRASALLALMMAFAAACSSPAASPTAQPAKPTAPPAAAGAPAASPAAAASPGAAASPAASPAAQAQTTSVAAALAGPKPAERKSIAYGATGLSWNLVPEMVAQDKGFFESENLAVDTIMAGASASVCQQLLAKAIQIGGCSLNDMMQAVEASGAPLIMVMNETITALQYSLMTKSNIKTWADMKGKSIIVGGPKDNTVFYIRSMARANGLQDNEYDFQYAGTSGQRLAALKSGAVDGSLLTDPFDTQAEQDGFNKLDTLLPKYLTSETYIGGGPIVLRDWARDHPDEVQRFIRSILKSTNWILDPANKQELFGIVGAKLNLDQASFDRVYTKTLGATKQWTGDGQITQSAVQGVVQSLVDLGSISPPGPAATKFYETTYLEAALKPR